MEMVYDFIQAVLLNNIWKSRSIYLILDIYLYLFYSI